jgi:hypothetical protein
VGEVANEYATQGNHTGQFGVPTGDSYSDNTQVQGYCKQWFDFGKEINVCSDIQKKTIIQKYGQSQSVQLTMRNNSQFRYKYGDNRKVWIVAHGLANDGNDVTNISDAIMSQDSSAIVMTLTWSGAKRFAQPLPNQVDEWIRPSAQAVAKTLKEWGMTNASNLNMAGHSMGTMVINEIARAMNVEQGAGNTNQLIYLDPPNNLPGINAQRFDVDDDEQTDDSLYGLLPNGNFLGYQRNGVNANIMRAFTGLRNDGTTNTSGNMALNKTAKENITILTSDMSYASPTDIHGAVHQTWSKLISSNKLSINNLELYGSGVSTNYQRSYNKDETGMHATIYASGTNSTNATPENITYTQNNFGVTETVQKGRNGTTQNPISNIFTSTNNDAPMTQNQTEIKIDSFETNDKISLNKETKPFGITSAISDYQVVGNTITRTVCGPTCNGTLITPNYVAVRISGGNGVTPDSLDKALNGTAQQKLDSLIQLRNN